MNQFAIVCPSCKQLINRNSVRCPNCGWQNNSWGKLALLINKTNVTHLLIGVNVAFYALSLLLSWVYTDKNLGYSFSFFSPNSSILQVMGWTDPYRVWQSPLTLVSSIFLHGGLLHILFNMFWLHHLYPQTENIYGQQKSIFIYLVSGVAGSTLASLMGSSPVVGASGAIFGLMGSFVAFGYNNNNSFSIQAFSKQYLTLLIIMLFIGFIMPGVSNLSHLGGAGGGYLISKLILSRGRNDLWLEKLLFIGSITLLAVTLCYMLWNIISVLFF